jgi:hypothetical protein
MVKAEIGIDIITDINPSLVNVLIGPHRNAGRIKLHIALISHNANSNPIINPIPKCLYRPR